MALPSSFTSINPIFPVSSKPFKCIPPQTLTPITLKPHLPGFLIISRHGAKWPDLIQRRANGLTSMSTVGGPVPVDAAEKQPTKPRDDPPPHNSKGHNGADVKTQKTDDQNKNGSKNESTQ